MKITKLPSPKIGDLWYVKGRPDVIVLITGFTRMVEREFVKFTFLQSGREGTDPTSQFKFWYIPLVSENEKKVEKNT